MVFCRNVTLLLSVLKTSRLLFMKYISSFVRRMDGERKIDPLICAPNTNRPSGVHFNTVESKQTGLWLEASQVCVFNYLH